MGIMQADFYKVIYPRQLPSAPDAANAGFSAHLFNDIAWTPAPSPLSL